MSENFDLLRELDNILSMHVRSVEGAPILVNENFKPLMIPKPFDPLTLDHVMLFLINDEGQQQHILIQRSILLMMEILLTNGYLVEVAKDAYRITAKGWTFYHQGGYTGQSERSAAESTRLGKLELAQGDYQRNTVLLTLFVAIGTGLAAVYYLQEVIKNLRNLSFSWQLLLFFCLGSVATILTQYLRKSRRKRQ